MYTTDTSYSYIVVVTAANGCTARDTVNLQFINISCSSNSNNVKVKVCLRPPGNPNNCHTVCVSVNAVQALLNSGSYLGACLPSCEIPIQGRSSIGSNYITEVGGGLNVKVINNPTQSYFLLLTKSNSMIKFL